MLIQYENTIINVDNILRAHHFPHFPEDDLPEKLVLSTVDRSIEFEGPKAKAFWTALSGFAVQTYNRKEAK